MAEIIEFTDTLTEIGEGSVDFESELHTYTFLDFAGRGRVLNVQNFTSAASKLESLLNIADQKFIFVTSRRIANKRKTQHLVLFGQEQGSLYKVDMFGDAHLDFEQKFKIGVFISKLSKILGVFLIILSIPLIIFLVGFFFLPLGCAIFYFGRKSEKSLISFRETAMSVTAKYPAAMSI